MKSTLNNEQTKYYDNMIEHYKRYGRIGRVSPYNLEHAKKIAWTIIHKQNKNKSHSFSSCQGSVPLTGFQNYEQLKLF